MKRALILALLCGACTTPDIAMPEIITAGEVK